MSSALLDAVLGYLSLGWSVVPVPWMTKAPVLQGWPNLRITAEEAPRYFNGERANVGVILGPASSNLADVDLDCRETVGVAPWFLPSTTCMFGRMSARAAHWFYYPTGGFSFSKAREVYSDPTRKGKEAVLLELRIGGGERGCQTILPPSRHEEGEDIQWEPGGPGEPARVAGKDLEKQVRKVASAALMARHWPAKGQRHDAALAVGAALRRSKWSTSEIRLFVTAVCAAAGDEEPKDRRQAAVDSCCGGRCRQERLRHPKARRAARRQGDRCHRRLARAAGRRLVHTCPGRGARGDAGLPPTGRSRSRCLRACCR